MDMSWAGLGWAGLGWLGWAPLSIIHTIKHVVRSSAWHNIEDTVESGAGVFIMFIQVTSTPGVPQYQFKLKLLSKMPKSDRNLHLLSLFPRTTGGNWAFLNLEEENLT